MQKLIKRSLEAASGGYRCAGRNSSGKAAEDIRAGAHTVAAQAYHFAFNNPHGARIVQILPNNLVGSGICPKCCSGSAKLRENIYRDFEIWTDRADASGLGDFYAFQSRMTCDMIVLGEVIAVFETAKNGSPRLKQLHPDQLDRSKSRRISDTRYCIQGVEFDQKLATPVAYHIRASAGRGVSPAGTGIPSKAALFGAFLSVIRLRATVTKLIQTAVNVCASSRNGP